MKKLARNRFFRTSILAASLALSSLSAQAQDDATAAQTKIKAAGDDVAKLAGAAGAAGVAVMVVVWGIRVASRALKAPR